MSEPFRVVTADPAWRFGDRLPGKKRGAGKNYMTMSVDEIKAMKLPPIADVAILFLWRVSAMVEEAYQVGRAWGFEPKSEIVWQKLSKTLKPWIGMGRYVRAAHETCIIMTRGPTKDVQKMIRSRSIRSRFAAAVPVDARGRYVHSGKPEEFYDLVEQLVHGPYVELFARRARPGWHCIGDIR
jgi:N6-adenosine-specific RNA methylase IME4